MLHSTKPFIYFTIFLFSFLLHYSFTSCETTATTVKEDLPTNDEKYKMNVNTVMVLPGKNCSTDNCSNHGYCKEDSYCDCEFGWTGRDCELNYKGEYAAYVNTFSVLFAIVALFSLIQLFRMIRSDGFSIDIPKGLHILFLLLGIERIIWLQIDPHNYKKKLEPIVENLISGLGPYVIIFSYMLVVMLWALTYKKASIGGGRHGWFFRNIKPLFSFFIILFGVLEIVLRVLWRHFPIHSSQYLAFIGLYYLLMMAISLFIIFSFLYWGLRLYKNLIQFQNVNVEVKERLRRVAKDYVNAVITNLLFSQITVLTVGVTILSIVTVVAVAVTFIIELTEFYFLSARSFLAEQSIFRLLEISLSLLILYGLRKRELVGESSLLLAQQNEGAPSSPASTRLSSVRESLLSQERVIYGSPSVRRENMR